MTIKFINEVNLKFLEIETDTGFKPISKIFKTIQYKKWSLKTQSGLFLDCADNHILFDQNWNEIFVKNLVQNISYIKTINGNDLIVELIEHQEKENMFDIQVESANHRYYSNGILSHNTTIINALSYVLYGGALTNIKKDNLINKVNGKNMLVTLEFEKDEIQYRVERGRRPTIIKFFQNGIDLHKDTINYAQGEIRETQDRINSILGLSHLMFKHTVALNTYTEPFLSMRVSDQREVIEQLLGITLLSEKADKLKELNKTTKEQIIKEEYSIKGKTEANNNIEYTIRTMKIKQRAWLKQHNNDLKNLKSSIKDLNSINIKNELKIHKRRTKHDEINSKITNSKQKEQLIINNNKQLTKNILTLQESLSITEKKQCHACGQKLHDKKHKEMINNIQFQINNLNNALLSNKELLIPIIDHISKLIKSLNNKKITPYYETINDAYNHNTSLEILKKELSNKENEQDIFEQQIKDLQTKVIQKIDFTILNKLTSLKEHQEFLIKLLINNDSFIRKNIINQNLTFLNNRLNYYLEKIGLPHKVMFQNDLSVLIMEFGRDLDFDNLSRGERNRLILSLSWTFRDVWESLYSSINLLIVDELIDSGIDTIGLENSVSILKKMARDRNKSIFLISHRDELIGRVNNVLSVIKENGFTHLESEENI